MGMYIGECTGLKFDIMEKLEDDNRPVFFFF